jgi:hypothetical protein
MVSVESEPMITSLPSVPVIVPEPVIVAGSPKHLGAWAANVIDWVVRAIAPAAIAVNVEALTVTRP